MTNRPFQSDSTKIYDESSFQTAPAQFGQNHLLVTYGQERRTFDTTTTSIAGQPFQNLGFDEQNRQQFNQNILTPVKQTFPNGVSYTFPSQDESNTTKFRELGIDFNRPNQNFLQSNPNQYQPQQNLYQNQINQNQFQPLQFSNPIPPPPMNLTLQQQIALNELQKHALETMLLQETLKKNPFKLQFHFDGQTDTNDLCSKSNLHPINDLYSKESKKNVENPEAIHSDVSKRRTLQIKRKPHQYNLDKETQNQPEINSVEVQCIATKSHDGTSDYKCEKEVQTDRRVCFEKEPDNTKKNKKKKKKQLSRSVDDDSDSSSTYDDLYV